MAARPWLTKGNLEFIRAFNEAARAHFDRPAKEKNVTQKALPHLKAIQSIQGPYAHLDNLGLAEHPRSRVTCKDGAGNPVDKSSFTEPAHNWSQLFVEDAVESFGRAGPGAVATMAEAMLVANGLSRLHGAERIYFRGEHQYGWELKSRAQRSMERTQTSPLTGTNGISKREVDELRRFQAEVKAGTIELGSELTRRFVKPSSWKGMFSQLRRQGVRAWLAGLFDDPGLPDDDDPEWLPLMQHYDVSFGTRLLDVTRSIFAGLHFACIDWDGSIDFDTDGLLYLFLGHGRYLATQPAGNFDDEVSEFVPADVADSFSNWKCPEYMHHFNSKQSSMRELAQDGLFLVQGDLGVSPLFGGQGNFKLCVPHWAKARIVEELWFAGYTPERIVRGPLGRTAAKKAEAELAAYRKENVGWHSGLPPF